MTCTARSILRGQVEVFSNDYLLTCAVLPAFLDGQRSRFLLHFGFCLVLLARLEFGRAVALFLTLLAIVFFFVQNFSKVPNWKY